MRRRSVRYGIGLAVLGSDHWVWTDVPAQGSATVHVAFKPGRRGLHRVPTLTAETRFPLGTFRVWTVWRPAAQVLVYPAPEAFPPPLPPGEPRAGGAASAHQSSGEYDGVRAYRRGDPLKLMVWKKPPRSDELVSRDAQQVQRHELWLDLRRPAPPTPNSSCRACAPGCCRPTSWGWTTACACRALEIKPGQRRSPQKALPASAGLALSR